MKITEKAYRLGGDYIMGSFLLVETIWGDSTQKKLDFVRRQKVHKADIMRFIALDENLMYLASLDYIPISIANTCTGGSYAKKTSSPERMTKNSTIVKGTRETLAKEGLLDQRLEVMLKQKEETNQRIERGARRTHGSITLPLQR